MIDLRHLDGLPILTVTSRRAAVRTARAAGFRPRDVRPALDGAGPTWAVGIPAGVDGTHWTLLIDEQSLITVPATDIPDASQEPDSGWAVRHQHCRTYDWTWGDGYRRLTEQAWQRRTTALLPLTRVGPGYRRGVRNHLITALRMRQTGRPHEATYWLVCAEHAARPAGARRRRTTT